MANAKANIYPVQLQGAELNLNKYDAEIKQYSGFNKNNAPFVGGCLSNIFTKDETIEGATSKNTYIAPNGDVYRVNTEGLFKNDTKLIDTSAADFFDVVDLGADAFPENTVYVYDEDIYIYIKNNEFVYHTKDWEVPLISSDVIVATFNVNVEYNIVAAVVKREGTSTYYVWRFNSLGQIPSDGYYQQNENTNITITTEDAYKTPIIKRYDGDRDHGYVILFNNSTVSNTIIGCIYNSNLSSGRWQSIGISKIVFGSNTLTANKNIFNFTDNYAFVTGSDEISGSNNGFLPSYSSENGFKYNYSVSISGINCTITIDYTSVDYTRLHTKKGRIDLLKNWGIQYGVSVYTTTGTTQNASQYLNVDDDIGWYASLEDDGLATFKTGGIINDCVLTNNGIATGLSLPGGLVLITEWNTVDYNYVFFGENNETWRDNKYIYLWKNISNNHWYKLVKSIPALRKINNQIVINANVFFNSYDINSNKLYLFAPAWNNRLIGYKKMYPDYTPPSTVVTLNAAYANVNSSYMIASSINEYELADNSSLILNPVILKGWSGCFTPTVYSVDEKNSLFVNIYHSTSSSNEILYKYSFNLVRQKALVYKKLEDLPFPTNTDGNVQYSPSLFAVEKGKYGNLVFISEGGTAYKLMTYNNKVVMSYFLSTAVEGLQDFFTIQGQLYGILDNQIYNFSIVNEIANRGDFIVSVEGLQFVGNTPYEALFFSKTNRCLYSFTGANVLNAKQFVDKISEVRNYKYNPATQSIFLITDIGVIVYSLFGIYQIEFLNCQDMYLLNNGVILTDNEGTFKYVKYYKEETTDDYTKENIQLETMFYGMNNQTVTINDCLYFRIFSEEHESGELEVSATTLANRGRTTERTTFKIKASDWDAETHSIYLRYQPKEQRGLGISFKINSPFKIAALSVGSIPDAVLIDRVSKGAINAPNISSNNIDW